jgi:two-component system chemotaxis response regulator CheB
MPLNVLVVDDSVFFQRVLKEIINGHSELNVIGVANNGREAVEKVKSLKPDVVTMDYEMPMMDGVTAVRAIMSDNPLPILMLSSMTFSGAKITMDALDAGAADFMTKNFAEISGKSEAIKKRLYNTLLEIGKSILLRRKPQQPSSIPPPKQSASPVKKVAVPPVEKLTKSKNALFETSSVPKIVVIGASTGGPAALTEVLKRLPKNFPCPIVVVQHMPQNFTLAFSQRLNRQCILDVKEAEDGDILQAGKVFLAPGGKQLILDKNNSRRIKIIESSSGVNYKPCVDISLASICNSYGKDTLGIVLTGMGSDGCNGAKILKDNRATVWTQAKDCCVVYGMPMAVDKANLSNASLSLDKMAYHLASI